MNGQTIGLIIRDPGKQLYHELKAALTQPATPLFVKTPMKKFIFPHQTRVREAGNCPDCLRRIEAASAADGTARVPSPGDFSVCCYCGAILRYAADMQLRRVEDDDRQDLPAAMWDKLQECSRIFKAEARRPATAPVVILSVPKIAHDPP